MAAETPTAGDQIVLSAAKDKADEEETEKEQPAAAATNESMEGVNQDGGGGEKDTFLPRER